MVYVANPNHTLAKVYLSQPWSFSSCNHTAIAVHRYCRKQDFFLNIGITLKKYNYIELDLGFVESSNIDGVGTWRQKPSHAHISSNVDNIWSRIQYYNNVRTLILSAHGWFGVKMLTISVVTPN